MSLRTALDEIFSVDVCNDTVGGALLQYGCSDKRFACRIDHRLPVTVLF